MTNLNTDMENMPQFFRVPDLTVVSVRYPVRECYIVWDYANTKWVDVSEADHTLLKSKEAEAFMKEADPCRVVKVILEHQKFSEERPENWTTISEDKVRHIWAPDEAPEGEEEIAITPSWYSENGTPVDPKTGNDMSYVRTEIRIG